MSSDNRAAASLARTYAGGNAAFAAAVQLKLKALGMTHTSIEEPTGLSSNNTSTAADLVKMAVAASKYPDIVRITTDQRDVISIKGRSVEYHNTNRLIGQKGWNILLSKTGYTSEAGRCIIMRFQSAGKNIVMVLLDAKASSVRTLDALNIRRTLDGETVTASVSPRARRVRHYAKYDRRARRHSSPVLVATS
jgi:D-alanyl-D-alanine endopeptidase (penicillin-binding protein 7)